jgi:hypothetical protein
LFKLATDCVASSMWQRLHSRRVMKSQRLPPRIQRKSPEIGQCVPASESMSAKRYVQSDVWSCKDEVTNVAENSPGKEQGQSKRQERG